MESVIKVVQVVIAAGIFNVWLIRSGRETSYRGGAARNMKEEFAVYGLPPWSMGLVGLIKIALATLLIVGLWYPPVTRIGATGLAVMMLGALAMHFKAKDPVTRYVPAVAMLLLSVVVAIA